jgi:hypothetical protein
MRARFETVGFLRAPIVTHSTGSLAPTVCPVMRLA